MIFDAHFHIIDSRYPLIRNNGYLPEPYSLESYQDQATKLGIVGGAIISGSFQGFDQSYLIDALSALPDSYVGVANVPHDACDTLLDQLNTSRIRAVRFNLKRGGSATIHHLNYLCDKLYEKYGWHTELYIDSRQLPDMESHITDKSRISIDHLGLSRDGLEHLYAWAAAGSRVKCTGFGRIDIDPIPVIRQLYSINPSAVLFGTDLPSTRAERPFSSGDLALIRDSFTAEECHNILWQNASDWYAIDQT